MITAEIIRICIIDPRAQLSYFNYNGGEEGDRGSYFLPKKIPTSE